MIISHKYKLIFIHIPKNAGTFITKFLDNLDENLDFTYVGHATAIQCQQIIDSNIWENYIKICIIRNSWDFAVSLYSFVKSCEIHNDYNVVKNLSLNEFLLFVEKEFVEKDHPSFDQSSFVMDCNNNVMIDYLIDFNNLQTNLIKFLNVIIKIDIDTIMDKIPKSKINKSPRDIDYTLYYNTTNIELVNKIYKKDIEFFNFKFGDKSNNKILWPNNVDDNNVNNDK